MKLLFEWVYFVAFNVACLFVMSNMWKWFQPIDNNWIELFTLFMFGIVAFGYAIIAITWLMGDDDE